RGGMAEVVQEAEHRPRRAALLRRGERLRIPQRHRRHASELRLRGDLRGLRHGRKEHLLEPDHREATGLLLDGDHRLDLARHRRVLEAGIDVAAGVVAAADEGGAEALRILPLETDHGYRFRATGAISCYSLPASAGGVPFWMPGSCESTASSSAVAGSTWVTI